MTESPGVVETVRHAISKLDGNMLALLVMIVVLDGMFFWAIRGHTDNRHAEFMYVLQICTNRTGLDR